MRKNVRNLILAGIFAFTCSNFLISQITLEHTFNDRVTWTGNYNGEKVYPDDSYVMGTINNDSYNLIIYNSDYSLSSNNTYNFSTFQDYKIQAVQISKNVFNTDDSFEFMVTYIKTDNSFDNTYYKLILFDSNGNILKDFGTAYIISPLSAHIVNNNLKLMIVKTFTNNSVLSYETEIYSVPGIPQYNDDNSTTGLIQNNNNLEDGYAYPNPATLSITLPYSINEGSISTMNIFDMNGKLVESKTIDSHFNQINLNVANYTRGTYFYVVNGVSKKFIVE
jgi:hypothetical protein